jgi:hypothetical protein
VYGLTEGTMHKTPHYLATALLGLAAVPVTGCGDSTAEGATSTVSFTVTCLGKDDTGGEWDY